MNPFFLIGGPCVVESEAQCMQIAERILGITGRLGIPYIFKASYKKANRSRLDSYTGPDFDEAVRILRKVKSEFGLRILTDVHESHECETVAEFADYLQIPAFLCRQTDLLIAAGRTGKGVNIKKGQFMSPEAMGYAVEKVRSTGNPQIWLTERGTTFGYTDLVVDFTAVPRMQAHGVPVVVDATHSVQRPNQGSGVTGGDPDMIATIARCGIAAGCDGLFIEAHPDPANAMSDSGSQLQLDRLEPILEECLRIRRALS